jgi:hypothetical protein
MIIIADINVVIINAILVINFDRHGEIFLFSLVSQPSLGSNQRVLEAFLQG